MPLSPAELGEGPPGALVPCPRSQSWTPVEATSSTPGPLLGPSRRPLKNLANLGQGDGVGGPPNEWTLCFPFLQTLPMESLTDKQTPR